MLIKKLNQTGLTSVILLFVAAVGLIAFFVIASVAPFKDTLLSSLFPKPASHASEQCIQADSLPISVPVLVLEYYPKDPSNATLLDGVETGWKQDATASGRTIQFWEEKTQEMISRGIPLVNEGTKYHGYKDASAPQFLNYSVLEQKKFYTPMPKGQLLETKPAGNAYRPDYGGILKEQKICDYVDNEGVKEVWIYGYHNDNGIVPDESRMSSRYGDISNSQPKEEAVAEQFRMPICENSYVLYNFTYQPTGDPGNNLHNRGHQIENVIPFAEGETRWPPTVANSQGSVFWGDFSEYVQDNSPFVTQDGSRVSSYKSSCGNIHMAPNWSNAKTQGYGYNLTQQGTFNCETWNPDETKTTYIQGSCQKWGCSDTGFYKWWMQNMPGFNNGIEYQGEKMRNWWEAMYDFNAFIDKGRSLYGDSIFCDVAVPDDNLETSNDEPEPDLASEPDLEPVDPSVEDFPNDETFMQPEDLLPAASDTPDSPMTTPRAQSAYELIVARQQAQASPNTNSAKKSSTGSEVVNLPKQARAKSPESNQGILSQIGSLISEVSSNVTKGIAGIFGKLGL